MLSGFLKKTFLLWAAILWPVFLCGAADVATSVDVFAVGAPSDLAAAATGQNSVNLSWSAVGEAVSYNLYRNGSLIGSTTSLSYSDSGLSAGTQYYYQITSVDSSDIESSKSDPVYVTTNAAPAATSSADQPLGGQGSGGSKSTGAVQPAAKPVVISITFPQKISSSDNSVLLKFYASGATHMQISNYSDFRASQWEEYQSSKQWILLSGPGAKTVYARFMNDKGKISSVYFDSIITGLKQDNREVLQEISRKLEDIKSQLLRAMSTRTLPEATGEIQEREEESSAPSQILQEKGPEVPFEAPRDAEKVEQAQKKEQIGENNIFYQALAISLVLAILMAIIYALRAR